MIDLVGKDKQILDEEQTVMDNQDKVAEITERLQQEGHYWPDVPRFFPGQRESHL